jgi:hypothetical protein
MEIRCFDPAQPAYDTYIRNARTELLTTIKASITEQGVQPLAFATYIGLFANNTVVGFTESYRYDLAFGGYEQNPFAPYYDLNRICPSGAMAHIRTAFLDAPYRRRTPYFVRLYLDTAKMFLEQGVSWATLTTTETPYLCAMYEKMGAEKLCTISGFPGQQNTTVVLFALELKPLFAHAVASRREKQYSSIHTSGSDLIGPGVPAA